MNFALPNFLVREIMEQRVHLSKLIFPIGKNYALTHLIRENIPNREYFFVFLICLRNQTLAVHLKFSQHSDQVSQ